MADKPPLTPERLERRQRIADLTREGKRLYTSLQANAAERDALIVAEMQDGAVAKDIAAIADLSTMRVYKLRDNGLKRAKEQ